MVPCYEVDTPKAVLDRKTLALRKGKNRGARKDLTNQLTQSPPLIEEDIGAHTFELISSRICLLNPSSVVVGFWGISPLLCHIQSGQYMNSFIK